MVDPIERQDAIDAAHKNYDTILDFKSDGRTVADSFEDIINALPSAQPERKPGKWIKKMRVTETEKYISYDPEWYCACCGTKYDSHIAKIVNFCYVCGADMRGEQNE